MTREELKKQANEFIDYQYKHEVLGRRVQSFFTYWELLCSMIDFAEPREKRIAELEKENAELKDKLNNLSKVVEVRLANWQKYEEENKELKKKIENLQKYLDTRNCYRECAETWVKLTKAKELLTKVMQNTWSIDSNVVNEINKFLKECKE